MEKGTDLVAKEIGAEEEVKELKEAIKEGDMSDIASNVAQIGAKAAGDE